jgi:hypothetical protein
MSGLTQVSTSADREECYRRASFADSANFAGRCQLFGAEVETLGPVFLNCVHHVPPIERPGTLDLFASQIMLVLLGSAKSMLRLHADC